MDVVLLLAQAAPQRGNPLVGMLPLVGIFVLFYFIIIMPQRKQAREHADMVGRLNRGDTVVTTGGLIGEITGLKDDQVQLRTGTATVVVERARIARHIPPAAS